MKKKSIYMVIIAFFVLSCGASKNNNTAQNGKDGYKELAVEKLGDNVTYTMNEDESFVLCVSEIKGTTQQPRNMLSYMVINMKDNSTVLEDKIDGGSVNWVNDTELEVFRTPGIMRNDQTRDDYTTVYNIKTGKSYPKKNTEQH